MEKKLAELKNILAEVDDLSRANALLGWDQQAYMPPGGAQARGSIMGTVSKIAHQKFTSKEVGKLLEALKAYAGDLDPDSDDARLIKVTQRDFEKSTKVPAEMVAERAEMASVGGMTWRKARENSDFSSFESHLEKVVDWNQRYAELFAPYDHVYDTVLDNYEPNMKTAEVQAIFDDIRPKQVELIKAIADKEQPDNSFLYQHFDEQKQLQFGEDVFTQFGFDLNRGRQDKVTHPFATNLGYGDQRITIRFGEEFFNPYIFGALHEAGHGMYEQGIGEELARSPLYSGASLAVHESQSRMWENLVGRSRQFWVYYFPKLQELFPSQLGEISSEEFYLGINQVKPSLIRVEADEATYNLHIMLRLEIEIGMLDGSFKVKDLPEIWNSRMQEYLGITPPDDAQGVLQDVHWSMGYLGYFSTYALGNLISVQLWEKIQKDIPDLYDKIENADFAPLLAWLGEKIHRHGAKFEPQELVERITGSKINGGPYLNYLQDKFSEIYKL